MLGGPGLINGTITMNGLGNAITAVETAVGRMSATTTATKTEIDQIKAVVDQLKTNLDQVKTEQANQRAILTRLESVLAPVRGQNNAAIFGR